MRVVLTGVLALLTVVFVFTACKKTTAPALPALDSASNMATVTAIVSGSDSARLTQTCVVVQTETALALLFTPTITMTSTQTSTATATLTATETPPPYVIYDDMTAIGSAVPAKWDVSTAWIGSTAEYKHLVNDSMFIKSNSYNGTPGSEFQYAHIFLTSKYPVGTKGFKGEIIFYDSMLSNNTLGGFRIDVGNTTDGFTRFFTKDLTSHQNPMSVYPILFEVKNTSGNTYSINMTDCETKFHNFSSQPQIKICVVTSIGEVYIALANCYYY